MLRHKFFIISSVTSNTAEVAGGGERNYSSGKSLGRNNFSFPLAWVVFFFSLRPLSCAPTACTLSSVLYVCGRGLAAPTHSRFVAAVDEDVLMRMREHFLGSCNGPKGGGEGGGVNSVNARERLKADDERFVVWAVLSRRKINGTLRAHTNVLHVLHHVHDLAAPYFTVAAADSQWAVDQKCWHTQVCAEGSAFSTKRFSSPHFCPSCSRLVLQRGSKKLCQGSSWPRRQQQKKESQDGRRSSPFR